VYLELQQRLLARVREVIQTQYGIELGPIAIEQPPDLKLGEFALPVAFELARKLRKAPKIIATELATALTGSLENSRLRQLRSSRRRIPQRPPEPCRRSQLARRRPFAVRAGLHVLVEHTSINPNKAAHIGHLRNAILGDTFVRILRANGQKSTCKTTSTTPASRSPTSSSASSTSKANLWPISAASSKNFETMARALRLPLLGCLRPRLAVVRIRHEEENKQRKSLRYATLHEIEAGGNETAE
jgi:arginyl-tRNA synthetase